MLTTKMAFYLVVFYQGPDVLGFVHGADEYHSLELAHCLLDAPAPSQGSYEAADHRYLLDRIGRAVVGRVGGPAWASVTVVHYEIPVGPYHPSRLAVA